MCDISSRCLRYDDTELDKESLRKVKEELKETDEMKKICLEKLKAKLKDNTDLNPCLNNDILLAYLRVAKFDISKAYLRVLKYYEERKNHPEIFGNYVPESVKPVEAARQVYACPYRAKDHSAIFIIKRRVYDPSEVDYELIIRGIHMISDLIVQHPINQMCGVTCIIDLKSSALSSFSEYTPSRLRLVARIAQKSVAVRIRKIHIINASSIYYLLYSIIYPFLSAKLRNRIIVHKRCTDIVSYIEPENLPKEYGGYLEMSQLINMFERLYKMKDFFVTFSKYGFIQKKK